MIEEDKNYFLRVKKNKSTAQFKIVRERGIYLVELKTVAELKREYGVREFNNDSNDFRCFGTHFIDTPGVDTPERDFYLLGKIHAVEFDLEEGVVDPVFVMYVYSGIYTILPLCTIKRFVTKKEYNRIKRSKKIGETDDYIKYV